MMIVGVSLFVRMVQVLFRPRRMHHRCPSCGLSEHESDAIYCKRCARHVRRGAGPDLAQVGLSGNERLRSQSARTEAGNSRVR
jgi:hypothetical protein